MATDKRVIKTRDRIFKAFGTLTKTKELDKITISDVALEAGINRSTFYKHYKDVNEIIEAVDKKIKDRISSAVSTYGIININRSLIKAFTSVVETMNSSELLQDYILNSVDSIKIINKIKKITYDIVVEDIAVRFPLLAPEKYVFAVTYVSSGCIDSFIQWARRGKNTEPFEKFIVPIARFNDYIFRDVMTNNTVLL